MKTQERQTTREDIGTMARNFLQVLQRENIASESGLKKKIGQSFDVDGEDQDYIQITQKPLSRMIVCQYQRADMQIPIEIRVTKKGSTSCSVASATVLPGYGHFLMEDSYGNKLQDKYCPGKDSLRAIKAELRSLMKYERLES